MSDMADRLRMQLSDEMDDRRAAGLPASPQMSDAESLVLGQLVLNGSGETPSSEAILKDDGPRSRED